MCSQTEENVFEASQNKRFSINKRTSSICGEIYCHSPTEFTIYCEHCELKSTEYDKFLSHFKLMHSGNIPLQPKENDNERASFVNISVKVEVGTVEQNRINFCKTDVAPSVKFDEESKCLSIVESNEFHKVNNFSCIDEADNPELQKKITFKKQRKCRYCGKTYKTTTYLQNHITLEHALNNAASVLTAVKCTECSEQFPNHHILINHSIKEHNGIQCSYCHRKFKCKASLLRHTEEIHTHSNNAKFECDFENCPKRFYTKQHLNHHKRSTHGQPKNYICDVCGFNCRAKGTLRKHSQIHSDDRPYPCDVCSAKFKSKIQLQNHSDVHNRGEKRNFLCDFENCTKTFFSGRRLADHMRRHKMPEKYFCDVCSYSSKYNQSLRIHYRKHIEEITNETC